MNKSKAKRYISLLKWFTSLPCPVCSNPLTSWIARLKDHVRLLVQCDKCDILTEADVRQDLSDDEVIETTLSKLQKEKEIQTKEGR